MLGALYLFYETHRQLGRNWSVTLETRKKHELVDTGLYAYVRHPMYSAFWLLASRPGLFSSPNWIAGLSGIVGWGLLFFLRVGHEERLMIDTFGREYVDYMNLHQSASCPGCIDPRRPVVMVALTMAPLPRAGACRKKARMGRIAAGTN